MGDFFARNDLMTLVSFPHLSSFSSGLFLFFCFFVCQRRFSLPFFCSLHRTTRTLLPSSPPLSFCSFLPFFSPGRSRQRNGFLFFFFPLYGDLMATFSLVYSERKGGNEFSFLPLLPRRGGYLFRLFLFPLNFLFPLSL